MTLSLFSCCCNLNVLPQSSLVRKELFQLMLLGHSLLLTDVRAELKARTWREESWRNIVYWLVVQMMLRTFFCLKIRLSCSRCPGLWFFIIFLSLLPKWFRKPNMLVLYMCLMELGTPSPLTLCILTYLWTSRIASSCYRRRILECGLGVTWICEQNISIQNAVINYIYLPKCQQQAVFQGLLPLQPRVVDIISFLGGELTLTAQLLVSPQIKAPLFHCWGCLSEMVIVSVHRH